MILLISVIVFLYLAGYAVVLSVVYEDNGFSLSKLDWIVGAFWFLFAIVVVASAIKTWLYIRKQKKIADGVMGDLPVIEEPCDD